MNEITLEREDGGLNVVVDGEIAIKCGRGWEVSNPVLTFEKAGRSYVNAILSYVVDGGYGREDRAWALDELNANEASGQVIAQAARDFTDKKIGFAEFKRIVRENS
jgi:hypothetical protein